MDALPLPLARRKPLAYCHLTPPFDRLVGRIPDDALNIPSMMADGEKEFLYGLAKDYYSGAGLIIDAGIFLGGSTVCMGSGLRLNPHLAAAVARFRQPIVSFELGITNRNMLLNFRRHGIARDLRIGDSFKPVVEHLIAPVRDLVDLRIGNILELGRIGLPGARVKTPVEILFLDVLKSLEIGQFCLREYFTRLIPRRSIVIQQDYLNGDMPFIHHHQEFFASKFEYIGEVSSSAIFRLVHRITPQEVEDFLGRPEDLEANVTASAIAGQRSIDPHRRILVAFSTLRSILAARGQRAAREYLAFIELEYAQQLAQTHFRRVQNVIEACRYLCEHGLEGEAEAMQISTGHRGLDHRRTDLRQAA